MLVVDDEPVLVDTIRYNLRREGYEVQAPAGDTAQPVRSGDLEDPSAPRRVETVRGVGNRFAG